MRGAVVRDHPAWFPRSRVLPACRTSVFPWSRCRHSGQTPSCRRFAPGFQRLGLPADVAAALKVYIKTVRRIVTQESHVRDRNRRLIEAPQTVGRWIGGHVGFGLSVPIASSMGHLVANSLTSLSIAVENRAPFAAWLGPVRIRLRNACLTFLEPLSFAWIETCARYLRSFESIIMVWVAARQTANLAPFATATDTSPLVPFSESSSREKHLARC